MRSDLVRILVLLGALVVVLGAVAVLWAWWNTQSSIQQLVQEAMEARPGTDRVEALIAIVDDASYSLEERNGVVWGLGRLKDPRALPVLQKYYTGELCDHVRNLCQYELKKSILKIVGRFVGFGQAKD